MSTNPEVRLRVAKAADDAFVVEMARHASVIEDWPLLDPDDHEVLGVLLTDSPVGQLAWMVDKFKAWTWPPESLPEDILGARRLLDHVSLYWFTGTAATSAYTGYATQSWESATQPSTVPTEFLELAHDIGIHSFVEHEHDVARWTDLDRGGHFAAMEEPDVFVEDLRAFFRTLRT